MPTVPDPSGSFVPFWPSGRSNGAGTFSLRLVKREVIIVSLVGSTSYRVTYWDGLRVASSEANGSATGIIPPNPSTPPE